jgi:hypothetical protein
MVIMNIIITNNHHLPNHFITKVIPVVVIVILIICLFILSSCLSRIFFDFIVHKIHCNCDITVYLIPQCVQMAQF